MQLGFQNCARIVDKCDQGSIGKDPSLFLTLFEGFRTSVENLEQVEYGLSLFPPEAA